MASLREVVRAVRNVPPSHLYRPATSLRSRRCASTQATEVTATGASALEDLEADSSVMTPPLPEDFKVINPVVRAGQRKIRLPASRYQYHPPKFNRGPLHPIQSPPSSDPIARDFVPGPFTLPRLRQTYESTFASDIMTLTYKHKPPGTEEKEAPERLHGWDGSSPYHENRPRKGPRGDTGLKPLEKDITFRNIPEIRAITLATYIPRGIKEPDRLVVAKAALQAITGQVPRFTMVKSSVSQWGITAGKKAGVRVTIYGNDAYEFLDKCIHLVFPRIKEWKGIKGSTGDSSGNLAWGFTGDELGLFPEIEVNYSMYPAKMIPGCRVFVETTAKSDRHARLLFHTLGVPFYGELRD